MGPSVDLLHFLGPLPPRCTCQGVSRLNAGILEGLGFRLGFRATDQSEANQFPSSPVPLPMKSRHIL